MNRNDFLNMIENIVPVNYRMIGEVYELINIFPYFQSAHMLLLKGLQNNADVKFEAQLRNSAIHIADREVLYYLLNANTSLVISQDETISKKVNADDVISDTHQTVIESAKNSEHLIIEIEKSSGESHDGFIDASQNGSGHTILISSESDNIESSGIMLLNNEEATEQEEQVFYMDPGFSVPEQTDLLELDLEEMPGKIAEEIDFDLDHGQDYSSEEGINSRKKMQSELIDKFINTNPRIEPNREKSNIEAEDISKPFVEEEGGFVTETLARIYISQGYYSKAIDIYEKLCLKFPEKSSYFASQIEKVEEYLKK